MTRDRPFAILLLLLTNWTACVEQDSDRSHRDDMPHESPEGIKRYNVFTRTSPGADVDDVGMWGSVELTAVSKSQDLSGQGKLWLTEMVGR